MLMFGGLRFFLLRGERGTVRIVALRWKKVQIVRYYTSYLR